MANSEQYLVARRDRIAIKFLFALLLAAAAGAQTLVAPAEILVCWEGGQGRAKAGPGALRLAGEYDLLSEEPLWASQAGSAKPARLEPELSGWSRLTFARPADPRAMAAAYARLPGVRWAQPNNLRRQTGVPDDSLHGQQWSLGALGWTWDQGAPAEEVVVGVIDSGVDWRHPDLAGQIWENPKEAAGEPGVDDDGNGYVDDLRGWDFSDAPDLPGVGDYLVRDADPDDESGHGTHVAGLIAAAPDNQLGIAGVAAGARLMILRAGFNIGGSGYLQDDDVAAAIVYAADQGAQVVNMSFGDPNFSPLIRDVVRYAARAGCVLVGAAGNENSAEVFYPARLPEVIAVGATGRQGGVLAFSNYGYSLDLAAPGLALLSLLPGGQYGERSGTSMAAALVSGLAAGVLGRHPEFSAAQVRGALQQTALDLGEAGWDARAGAGLVQFGALRAEQPATLELFYEGSEVGLKASGEGSFDLSWNWLSGVGPWVELARGSVKGVQRAAAAWPPAGLADGSYLVRGRFFGGNEVREERLAVEPRRAPGTAQNLVIQRALNGGQWTLVAAWEAAGAGPDTLLIRGGSGEVLYELPDYSSRSARWLPLPGDLPSGQYRAQVGSQGPEVEFAFERDPVRRWGLEAWGRLPAGYLMPVFGDFSGEGQRELVAMRKGSSPYNPVDFYEEGVAPPAFTSSLLFLPWGRADLDGDGLGEMVGVDAQRVRLIEALAPGAFPTVSVWQQQDAWGGEVADLDMDGQEELLLRSARAAIFQVFEAVGENDLREKAVLANPTPGENEAGERQVAGDLDGDGRGELLCGDGDGDLWIYEAIGGDAYRLTWQREGGGDARLVGGGVDLDGDGRREFVVGRLHQDPYDLRQNRWAIEVYEAQENNDFALQWQTEALGGTSSGNGITAGDWNGDGLPDLAVNLPPRLYVFTADEEGGFRPVWEGEAGAAHRPAAGDLDGDGRVDLAYLAPQGIHMLALAPGLARPAGLKGRPLGSSRISLSWDPVPSAEEYRVYRDEVRLPGATRQTSFTDTALSAGTRYGYQVSAVAGGEESLMSEPVLVQPQAAPRILGVERLGDRQLGVGFDQPMAETPPYRLRVEPGVGMPSSAVLDRSGKRLMLAFDRALPDSGAFSLWLRGVQGANGGPLAQGEVGFSLAPVRGRVRLSGAEVLDPGRIRVRFSGPIDAPQVADFALAGGRQQIVGLQWEGAGVVLVVEPPLRPTGVRYTLRVAGVVSAVGDTVEGKVLLALAAPDLERVAFFPNPFRSGGDPATFGFLPLRAQVRIFDLEGRLQQLLVEEDGDGGVSWDGRGADGRRLPSGVYLFLVQAGAASKQGKLALICD